LLLHGLGANAGVWRNLLPFIEKHWPGALDRAHAARTSLVG
jgi:hypothetical protein